MKNGRICERCQKRVTSSATSRMCPRCMRERKADLQARSALYEDEEVMRLVTSIRCTRRTAPEKARRYRKELMWVVECAGE